MLSAFYILDFIHRRALFLNGAAGLSVRCTYDEDVEQQHRHANHRAQLNAIDRLMGEANPKTSQAHQNEVHDIL